MLKSEDTLLVRGATCALGYAVIQLAKALGCRVIGTTHRESKFSLLEEAGADELVFSNYPTQEIMDEIFAFLNAHDLQPRAGQVFDLAHIRDAVAAQDSRKVNGKVVVTV